MECSFPKNLAALRHERGISQKMASEALGISQALLSHYEKGIRECGLDFLCRAADYYGVTADYLLGRSESRTGFSAASESPELQQRRELCRILELLYDIVDKAGASPLAESWDAFLRMAIYRSARLLLEACDGHPEELFTLNAMEAQAAATSVMDMRTARLARATSGAFKRAGKPAPYISRDRLMADYPDTAPSLLLLLQDIEEKLEYRLNRYQDYASQDNE